MCKEDPLIRLYFLRQSTEFGEMEYPELIFSQMGGFCNREITIWNAMIWEDQAANEGLSKWDSVKNKQSQKNMKSMHSGDLCFFYHSGSKARRMVGVVSVVCEWYADDNGSGAVYVKEVGEMRKLVDLAEMKKDSELKGFGLIRQPRLSVVLVEKGVWKKVCQMGGGFEGDEQ